MVKFVNGIYEVEGRINASTAEQFKAELSEAFEKDKVILDFDKVEYISSAGLRVLLALVKSGTAVEVTNVCSEVYEVFDTTGFVDLVKVSRKLKEISIDGCKMIGRGATGTVYKVEDDMVVKVYHPGTPFEVAESEREFAKNSFVLGVPTAIPFDVVKVGDCYGSRFELVDAITLGEAFTKYPERYEEFIEKYVKLINDVRSIEDTKGNFRNIKEILHERIMSLKGILPDNMVETVSELLKTMPNSKTLVHGDLHTGNVMLQGDELVIIDMADMTTGPQSYDLMALYRDLYWSASKPEASEVVKTYEMPVELCKKVCVDVLTRCLNVNADELENIMKTYALITETGNIAMAACMPKEFILKCLPIIEGLYSRNVEPNIDAIRTAMANM